MARRRAVRRRSTRYHLCRHQGLARRSRRDRHAPSEERSMKMQPSNPIELAVFNNLLGAIAEEMCAIVERTAYTTFVKETHDFGAGIATPDGVFFAYPRKSGVTSFLGL